MMATCTVISVTVAYTSARCVCGHRLMDIPGHVHAEVRLLRSEADRTGRGRAIKCSRCGGLLEVIEHGEAA
jgi:DNA-directed RNA polymerase subunit RPC12/RpoP